MIKPSYVLSKILYRRGTRDQDTRLSRQYIGPKITKLPFISILTWPQMIQFWDVDLSAIHQKFRVNLPPKLEWYDLHSCSHEQKTKSVFVHHWNQISVNSVFYFLYFRKSHKKSHNLSTSSCNSCRKLLKLWGQTWNFN